MVLKLRVTDKAGNERWVFVDGIKEQEVQHVIAVKQLPEDIWGAYPTYLPNTGWGTMQARAEYLMKKSELSLPVDKVYIYNTPNSDNRWVEANLYRLTRDTGDTFVLHYGDAYLLNDHGKTIEKFLAAF